MRPPCKHQWELLFFEVGDQFLLSFAPVVVWCGEIDENWWIRNVLAKHAVLDVLDPGWHHHIHRRKDVTTLHTDPEAAASAHRDAAEVDAVAIDLIGLDRPFDGRKNSFFRRTIRIRIFLMLPLNRVCAPPPVVPILCAIEVDDHLVLKPHVVKPIWFLKGSI